MSYVVLFNAPPRAGKSQSVLFLQNHLNNQGIKTKHYAFSDPLKSATHYLYGLFNIPNDHFEHVKDKPCEEFGGLTPRNAYIMLSEQMVKPVAGKDFFGKIGAKFCEKYIKDEIIVISDLGFTEEMQEVINLIGNKIILIRIHKKGVDFSNDSRQYIHVPKHSILLQADLENNGTLDELNNKMYELSRLIIKKEFSFVNDRGVL